jgi:hypothetical protein
MLPPHVLTKMRTAVLLAGATGATASATAACTRGKATAENADASSEGGATTTTIADDASIDGDIAIADDGGILDASDDALDAFDAAPFGSVACPIHGSHPKLPDGGVLGAGGKSSSPGTLTGIGGPLPPGIGVHECWGCGMGGISHEHEAIAGPTGDVQIGTVTAVPNSTEVNRLVAGMRGRFKACYNAGLKGDPTIAGKLVIRATFAPNGESTSVDVVSNSGLPSNVASCVVRSVRNMQVSGATTITLPVAFAVQK